MFDWLEDAASTIWSETKGVFNDVLDYQKSVLDHNLASQRAALSATPTTTSDLGASAPASARSGSSPDYQQMMLMLGVAGVAIALFGLLRD